MSTTKVKNNPDAPESHSARNILIKTVILFILVNMIFAFFYPLPVLGKVSAYNHLFPGRQRLPYSDSPQKSYNLSLFNLEAMFASHELSGKAKSPDEFRVIFIGDSATWGFLLPNDQTLTTKINAADLQLSDGRRVRAYNLGYPVMSLTKDLLILSDALRYQPDLIVWPVTLESFPYDKQLYPPLLLNNPDPVKKLVKDYRLNIDLDNVDWVEPGLWGRTIVGARRALADVFRLQLYGVLWAATGIDQDIPSTYTARQEDLQNDLSFHDLKPGQIQEKDLAVDILAAGIKMAGNTPMLLINEPMFISRGENSDIRYNFYYPRWAYDGYREIMSQISNQKGWNYKDYWNVVPAEHFTNSAVHMDSNGVAIFARYVEEAIKELANHKSS